MNGMQLNTDFSGIKPSTGAFPSFPASDPIKGWLCHIVDSEGQPTKDKTGHMCVLTLEGLEPGVQGQTHTYRINVANANTKAVEIGMSELSAIAHVIGVLRVANTVELHRKPFRVIVAPQAGDAKYMEITGVRDANGNKPGQAGQGPAVAQPAAQGGFAGVQPAGGFTPQGQPAQQPTGQWNGGGAPQGQPQGGQPAWNGQPPGNQPGPDQVQPQGGNWQPVQQQPQGVQGQPAQQWQPNPQGGQPQGGGGAPSWANTAGQ